MADGIGVDNGSTLTTNLTVEQVRAVLVEPLEQAATFLQAGPQIIDTDGSPVRLPTIAAADVDGSYWTAENEQITEIEPEFDEVMLLPSTMGSIKTLTRYSNELARQSVIGLDGALQARLVRDVATRIDKQLLSDDDGKTQSGDRARPAGLFSYAGQSVDAGTAALDLEMILEAQGLALEAGAAASSMRLLVRPADYIGLRALKDADERYMLQPDATAGAVGSILGTPVLVSSHIPDGHAALVDFQHIAVARDMRPTVTVLRERYADYDQQAIRVVARYDAAPLNADAIVAIENIDSHTFDPVDPVD